MQLRIVSLADSISLSAKDVVEQLKARGVLVGVVGVQQFRLVLHYEVDDAGVEQAFAAFNEDIFRLAALYPASVLEK